MSDRSPSNNTTQTDAVSNRQCEMLGCIQKNLDFSKRIMDAWKGLVFDVQGDRSISFLSNPDLVEKYYGLYSWCQYSGANGEPGCNQ